MGANRGKRSALGVVQKVTQLSGLWEQSKACETTSFTSQTYFPRMANLLDPRKFLMLGRAQVGFSLWAFDLRDVVVSR